jgi:hypothetical protein
MNETKQQLLLEYIISSQDVFALTSHLLVPQYFDPSLRLGLSWTLDYYNKYRAIPTTDQIKAETGLDLKTRDILSHEVEYCCAEIEQFAKRKAIEAAVIEAPSLIKEGKYETLERAIKDALLISLNHTIGLDYLTDWRMNSSSLHAKQPDSVQDLTMLLVVV